jgi:hypothetical protein
MTKVYSSNQTFQVAFGIHPPRRQLVLRAVEGKSIRRLFNFSFLIFNW